MTRSAIVGAAVLLAAVTQESPPACALPEAPAVERPVKPTRPDTPSCVDEARNRHTCSNRVIETYNGRMAAYSNAFDEYVAAVNGYVERLVACFNAANDYAQCEQPIVMPSRLITG